MDPVEITLLSIIALCFAGVGAILLRAYFGGDYPAPRTGKKNGN